MTSHSKNDTLGITTKSTSLLNSDYEKKAIVERYALQSFSRELLPNHRVCVCCRFLSHNAENVKIVYRTARRSVGFKGLARCACLWVCPVCAAIISEKRKSELKTATTAHNGDFLLFSYTLRHTAQNKLKDVLEVLQKAFNGVLAGSFGEDFRAEFGVVGTVRAIEVTHGKSGWHPHIHQIMFTRKLSGIEFEDIEDTLKRRWVQHVKNAGGSATYKSGVDVKRGGDFLAQYIAKFGHEPKKPIWGAEHELSKAVQKKGRNGGRNPLQLLSDYGEGDKRAGYLFQEYAYNFFGKRQLVWSRGLKELLGVGIESDEEIIEKEEKDGNFRVLAVLSGLEWRRVRELKFQAVLLLVAMNNDETEMERFLIDNYIRSSSNGKETSQTEEN